MIGIEDLGRLARTYQDLRNAETDPAFASMLGEFHKAMEEVEEEIESIHSVFRFSRLQSLLLTRKILRSIVDRITTAYRMGKKADEELMRRDPRYRMEVEERSFVS